MAGCTRITLADIAEKLRISRTAVSLALNDSHRISPERRKQVQRAAKEMGYVPDPFLAGLCAYRRRSALIKYQGTIAWVRHWKMPEYRSKFAYHRKLWQGASQAAQNSGHQLEEFCWGEDFSAKRFAQILLTRGIRGLLIPPHRPGLDWRDFDWSKFSIVRFGLSVPVPDSNLVTADTFRAMAMAVNRIHQYGYKRIGLVVGEFDADIGGNFSGGFFSARFIQHDVPTIPPLVTSGERYQANTERENERLQRWIERHRPDAIITTEAQLPGQLRELGYRIPLDIAVAASNIPDVGVDAGIDQHAEAIGRIAVEMLVKQINVNERGEPEDPCRILVESRWLDGKSLPRRPAV